MYDDYDSLMDEVDDILYNEEDEKLTYKHEVEEINEYWDRENEYIKSSGIIRSKDKFLIPPIIKTTLCSTKKERNN